jgi:hypothetical protein
MSVIGLDDPVEDEQPETPSRRVTNTASEPPDAAATPVDANVPKGVLDPVLYQLVTAVVAELDEVAAAYLAQDGYKYVPKRQTQKVDKFDSGWPNVSSYKSDTEMPAYGKLFAETEQTLQPLAYEGLTSMPALFAYVESNPDLYASLQMPNSEGKHTDVAESMYRYMVTELPCSIYDRAMALGLPLDSPAVADLYKARETSWLAKELPYELVVPLLLTDLQIDDTFHIDADARFEKLSDEDLRAMFVDYDLSGVPQPLALAAKHALVVKMPPLTNTGEPAMVFLPDPDTDPDLTKVRFVCEALRIVSSARVGWARMFRRPLGWTHSWKDALPVFSIQHTSREYPAAFDNYGWLKTGDAVATDELDKLPAVFAAMANASAKAKLAARRLSMADVRDDADDQLVDACIGLEALLGQEGAELSYRVAVRAAALLSSKKDKPIDAGVVFDLARKVYNRRSELVHGSVSGKHESFTFPDGTTMATHYLAAFLLREVLLERLLRVDNWKVEDLDALVLQKLNQPPAAST